MIRIMHPSSYAKNCLDMTQMVQGRVGALANQMYYNCTI